MRFRISDCRSACAARFAAVAAMAALLCGFNSREWMAKRNDEADKERLEAAFAELSARKGQSAEDITLPLERFENGAVKATLEAKRAWIFTDTPFVVAENVHVRRIDSSGRVDFELDAAWLIADRKTKTFWIEGTTRIAGALGASGFEATGSGIYFSSADDMLRVYRNTRITVPPLDLKMEDLLP